MKVGGGECGAIDEGVWWRGTTGAEVDYGAIGGDQAAQDSQRRGRWRRHRRRPDGRAAAPSPSLMSGAMMSHHFFIVSDVWAPLLCATDMWADLLTLSNGVRIIPSPFHELNKK
jgi:hypothetical protein